MVSEMQHIFTITKFCVPLCTRYEFFSQNNLKSVFNRSGQRSGFDSRSRLKIFRFFFNRLDCLFNCKDLIHLTSLSAVQNMIHFIYFNSWHFHYRVYYELVTACCPVGLISLMDRAMRRVTAQDRVRRIYRSSLNFFRFFLNRLGCLFNCEDHVHFHKSYRLQI